MSFSAIVQADTLSDAIEPVSALVDECKLNLGEDGLEVRAVDPANVAMVEMKLSRTGCESYDADGGVIGIDLDRLEDVLSMAKAADLVSLELDEETRKLEIVVDGLEYTLACIDPDSIRQEPDIPDLDLTGTYVFEGGEFDRAVRAADLVGDHIAIRGEAPDELVFAAEGDTDDVEVTLKERDLLSGDLGERCKSLFSLDYLSDINRPLGTDTECSLLLGDEFPLKLRYSRADGHVQVVNMLAPRIASD